MNVQRKGHVRTQQKGRIYKLRTKVSPETNLDLGLAASNVRKYICVVKPPSLWFSMMQTLVEMKERKEERKKERKEERKKKRKRKKKEKKEKEMASEGR